jgi:hypothetical protein
MDYASRQHPVDSVRYLRVRLTGKTLSPG